MEQRLSFVTLVVEDLDATRAFYVDGLGWRPEMEATGEVLMIRVGSHVVLSLWDEGHAAAEIGPVTRGGTPPLALAHNVASPEEVDAVLEHARTAGARSVSGAVARDWGGYTGYFADPDGFRWEVAYNPGPIGQMVLP
jgi:catechol 2,3-dioxygenase-like lactoylglutathione lyase family enzyme